VDARTAYIAPMRPALTIALLLQLAAFGAMAALRDLAHHLSAFLVLFAIALLGFLLALRAATARPLALRWILLAGLALRAPLLPLEPTLSDDVWRYLHDGRAQRALVNPYRHAPANAATAAFRGPEHDRINHPDLPTIYPPAAQLAFLAAAAPFGASLLAWKLLLLAAEAALIVALAALLRALRRPPVLAAVWAWHPLVIVEVAGSAHLEPVAVAPLVLGLALARQGRTSAAGAALGVSAAAKYLAAPLAPFLDRRRPGAATATAAAAFALLALPYAGAGTAMPGSLGVFARDWASNGGAFLLLEWALGTGLPPRAAAAGLLIGLLALLWRLRTGAEDAAFTFIFATLLLSPVVHPWYALWLVPLLPLAPATPARLAAALWTATIPIAYLALAGWARDGEWMVPASARLAQYAPVALLLAGGAVARLHQKRRGGAPAPPLRFRDPPPNGGTG
jgi:alpha-1,6-mannosyltransferase